jgi:hypothetical protein
MAPEAGVGHAQADLVADQRLESPDEVGRRPGLDGPDAIQSSRNSAISAIAIPPATDPARD